MRVDIIIALVLALVMAFLMLNSDATAVEENATNNEYCEMVELGFETNNEFGWGDYNGNYDELCK